MTLENIRDYIDSLEIAKHTYMGKLDHKEEHSIGVYQSKHTGSFKTAIGGSKLESYGIKRISLLVHWNKSPRETENAAMKLFNVLRETSDVVIKESKIKFIQLLYNEPISVGTDEMEYMKW